MDAKMMTFGALLSIGCAQVHVRTPSPMVPLARAAQVAAAYGVADGAQGDALASAERLATLAAEARDARDAAALRIAAAEPLAQARSAAAQLLAHQPSDARALVVLASHAAWRHDWHAFAAAMAQLHHHHPTAPAFLTLRALEAGQRGEVARARALLARLPAGSPEAERGAALARQLRHGPLQALPASLAEAEADSGRIEALHAGAQREDELRVISDAGAIERILARDQLALFRAALRFLEARDDQRLLRARLLVAWGEALTTLALAYERPRYSDEQPAADAALHAQALRRVASERGAAALALLSGPDAADAEQLRTWARAALLSGDTDAALRAGERLAARGSRHLDDVYLGALLAQADGKLSAARRQLARVLAEDPGRIAAQARLVVLSDGPVPAAAELDVLHAVNPQHAVVTLAGPQLRADLASWESERAPSGP